MKVLKFIFMIIVLPLHIIGCNHKMTPFTTNNIYSLPINQEITTLSPIEKKQYLCVAEFDQHRKEIGVPAPCEDWQNAFNYTDDCNRCISNCIMKKYDAFFMCNNYCDKSPICAKYPAYKSINDCIKENNEICFK